MATIVITAYVVYFLLKAINPSLLAKIIDKKANDEELK